MQVQWTWQKTLEAAGGLGGLALGLLLMSSVPWGHHGPGWWHLFVPVLLAVLHLWLGSSLGSRLDRVYQPQHSDEERGEHRG